MHKLICVFLGVLFATQAFAEQLTMVVFGDRDDIATVRRHVEAFQRVSPHQVDVVALVDSQESDPFATIETWLQGGLSTIDVYVIDALWLGQLAPHFLELNFPDEQNHFPRDPFQQKRRLRLHAGHIQRKRDEVLAAQASFVAAEPLRQRDKLFPILRQGIGEIAD